MKKTLPSLLVLFSFTTFAQTNRPGSTAPTNPQSRAANSLAWRGPPGTNGALAGATRQAGSAGRKVLAEIGPNHRSWKTEPDDSAGAPTNQFARARGNLKPSVVEIASGMNHWNGQQWSPSIASFELTDDAFVANQVQHRKRLNANLNVVGVVTTTLKDGTTLRSTPVAIALYDPNDGRFSVISTITNSIGVLVDSNRVAYADAFSGGVCADVIYTLQKGSFEQDVIITGRLNPLDYGFPTNSQIQVVTEFYNPPEPEKLRQPIYVEKDEVVRRRKVSPDLVDEMVGFGELVIGPGQAYTPPTATHPNGAQAAVAKEFRTIPSEGRTFLIETVDCPAIQDALNALPECVGGVRTAQQIRDSRKRDGYAFIPKPAQTVQAKTRPRSSSGQFAMVSRPGVVIDYVETLGGYINTPKVFESDTTYFVSDPVYCNYAVTIEGAAVFKYWNSTGNEQYPAKTTFIQLNNALTLKTGPYRPAIFTAWDDNSVGDVVPGSTGDPTQFAYANPALSGGDSLTLSHCRFSYAKVAIRSTGYGTATATVSHSQFINCVQGFSLISSGCGGCGVSVTANNCLIAGVSYLLDGSTQNGLTATMFLNHCTVATATKLIGPGTALYVNVTSKNSIFANVSAWGTSGYFSVNGDYNGFYANVPAAFGGHQFTSATSPFQPTGAGHYYLKSDSPFRAAGTTTVGSTLLNQLKTRTTQAPLEFPRFMQVSGELTLFPQIPRYVSGNPDLGFWYDALDYTVAAMNLVGGSVSVKPGAAVAVRNDCYIWYDENQDPWQVFTTWGFVLYDGSSFISQGTPQTPNTFTTVELVQDGRPVAGLPFGKWLGIPCRAELFTIAGNDPEPTLSFRFSNFSVPSQWCYHFISGGNSRPQYVSWINTSSLGLSLRDCNFTGGSMDLGYANGIPNSDPPALYSGVANLDWQNNLFDRVTMNLDPAFAPESPSVDFAFRAKNNLFRGCPLRLIPTPAPTIHPYLPGIVNLAHLAPTLYAQADPVSVYIYGRLSAGTQDLLANYTGGDDPNLQWELAVDLSTIILGVSIYDANRFAGVALRQETLDLLALNPTGPYLARLNRMLLEDAFPGDLLPMSLSLWVFKDNLFDKAAFEQYDSAPLDQDFNAYWKRLPAELEPWETDRLYPDAVNDRVLTVTPAYQTGPLGSFYLATTSELYSTNPNKRGSRSVTDAGLYHYTTRFDQTKDGAQSGNAIIGRHYVATASSSSTLPKDSETPTPDGVPDYVEDANGNNDPNDVTSGIETSPSLVQTTSGIADSLNTIYDDIDLDGDGMVGRIEKALNSANPQPLVPDNPLSLTQLITGEEPDTASFVVPINYDSLASLGELELDMDGASTELCLVSRHVDGNCRIRWKTTFDPPGERFLNVRLNLHGLNIPPLAKLTAAGSLLRSPVNNILRFNSFYSQYYDSAWLYAELSVPLAEYTVSLYNPSLYPASPPLRTFSGSASGVIEEYWDVTDAAGSPYTGDAVVAVFDVAVSGGAAVRHVEYKRKEPESLVVRDGGFTIAHTSDQTAQSQEWYAEQVAIQIGVVDPLLNPAVFALPEAQYGSSFNEESDGGLGGDEGWIANQARAQALKSDLALLETRNFYFGGHGSPNEIGNLVGTITLTRGEVAAALGNEIDPETQSFKTKHPYRLVLLNACSTARNPGWASAFGIAPRLKVTDLLRKPNCEQAFVGWSGDAWGMPLTEEGWEDHEETLFFLFKSWMSGNTIKWCTDRAQKRDPIGDGSIILDLPLGGTFRLPKDNYQLRIYGFDRITRRGWS